MTNREKCNEVFINTFKISENQLPGLKYQDIKAWDSVGHMQLIAELEDVFDIQFEMDDIVDFGSYEKGMELLKKYDVAIE